ncbi:MAG: peptidoglycan recognition protein family protein [Sporomusa sp.]
MNKADKDQLLQYLKAAKGKGIRKVYAHWTAGRYTQVFDDYHICIKGDGEVWFTTDNLAAILAHTYMRNTNAIGITLCCAYGATYPNNFGQYPPTNAQIETLAEVLAIISRELNIPIDIQHIMTHAEAADNLDGTRPHSPYGPKNGCERWDLYQLQDSDGQWKSGGDVLRGKAIWYQQNYG